MTTENTSARSALRVLVVLGSDGLGGSEAQARLLVAGLTAAGTDVDVIVLEGAPGQAFDARRTNWLGLKRGSRLRDIPELIRKLVWLANRINAGEYDVTHCIMARAHTLGPLLHFTRGSAVVAWRRNMGIHSRTKGVFRALEQLATNRTDLLICNSEDVQAYWQRNAWRPVRACVVENILPEARRVLRGAPRYRAGRPLEVLAIGGLKPVKRFDLLVSAISQLEMPIRLTILGEGPQRDQLVNEASNLQVALRTPGHTQDIYPELERADVFVQSSASEGLSNALLEAVAAGVPAVATDVGGTRTIFGDSVALIPANDVAGLREAIENVAHNYGLAHEHAVAARLRIADRFNERSVVNSHLRAYSYASELRENSYWTRPRTRKSKGHSEKWG